MRVALLFLVLLGLMPGALAEAGEPARDAAWVNEDGQLVLHVFHSLTCPHCRKAMPWLAELDQEHDWLVVEDYEVSQSRAAQTMFGMFADKVGRPVQGVPAFFFCGQMLVGFDNARGMGRVIEESLATCRRDLLEPAAAPAPAAGELPEMAPGPVAAEPLPEVAGFDLRSLSLPVTTMLLGGLDAFNPCAFFVLLFLLSLMVHARSRLRMAVIGGIFVVTSGLVYFAFMAAWLNLFLLIGQVALITTIAGAVALVIAGLNVKDFYAFQQGPSLSLGEGSKRDLFARMRGLLQADNLWTMAGGAVVLAVLANSYELLCTSGFPLVFTRILTLNELPTATYYGYLAFYNLVYVLPLAAIVAVFTFTLGARRLSEGEGRALKLLSGLMMGGLGLVLILAPTALENILVTIGVLAAALAGTALLVLLDRARRPVEGRG